MAHSFRAAQPLLLPPLPLREQTLRGLTGFGRGAGAGAGEGAPPSEASSSLLLPASSSALLTSSSSEELLAGMGAPSGSSPSDSSDDDDSTAATTGAAGCRRSHHTHLTHIHIDQALKAQAASTSALTRHSRSRRQPQKARTLTGRRFEAGSEGVH